MGTNKREYDRQWYAKQSRRNKKRIIRVKSDRRRKIRQQLDDYKHARGCSCGENHPACLEFHHHEDNKEINVSDALSRGWSFERIMKEIVKCKMLCANCHRKLHHRRKQ